MLAQFIGSIEEGVMRTVSFISGRRRKISSEAWIPLDESIDRPDLPADAVPEDALAYSFYALLDDAELREVFGSLSVAVSGSD
jgi:hypothetical protein